MCLAEEHNSDAGEARTRNPLVLSQALYHLAGRAPIPSLESTNIAKLAIVISILELVYAAVRADC